MTKKQLADKAISIKGKDYVLVSDRIIYFNETYTNGSIITSLVSTPDADMVVIKAKVTPDAANPDRYFTGYSQAKWGEGMVNKTAALENAETSAVGRALAMLGIGVLDSIASADEMNKAGAGSTYEPRQESTHQSDSPTPKQLAMLKKNGIDGSGMTKLEASKTIGKIIEGTWTKPSDDVTRLEDEGFDDISYEEEDISPSDIPF